ncbi:arylamine N-acetyltransferase family protein [Larkinella soli]|uniref:arylamine N-acetyltransferase family protein n=1 Tax=Larkinella soli TaxID=1770527 RepID=UPI000FFC9B79|nr:arylamine N-acetyltransferase [Larkinella soli]
MIDLDAYFHRIGYTGPRTPTLDTLRAIQLLHPQAIPFEGLNPLLRIPVRLDSESLQEKLIRGGRGGYCFEQNLLLMEVLQTLGFSVKGLAARVMWNIPEGVERPLTHLLLRIDLPEGVYLADVGFGGLTLTSPIRLEPDTVQKTPHEPFRLIRTGEEYILQAEIQAEWKALYRFTLNEMLRPDYEVFSWYLCTHPDSYFLHNLPAARATPDGRYALRNNTLTIYHRDAEPERRLLTRAADMRAALETLFLIRLPEVPHLDEVLERLTEKTEVTP